jgi:predicted TIM-barrel fold metal-dependent hydrolase
MAQLNRPIWLHPARTAAMTDYPAEQKSRFEMWWCFGWPYDTSVATVRLAFCGLFERYPNLKIITHHLGGMIPRYDGRHRSRPRCTRTAHLGRGLLAHPAVAQTPAPRSYARFLS